MGEEPSAAGEWHVVRTRAGAEDKAAIGIEKAGMEAFLPVELIRTSCRGNRLQPGGVMWQPLFMGHLLVRFDLGRDLRRVCEIYGVDDVVRLNGKVVPVADAAVRALRSSERAGLFDAALGCRVPDDDAPAPDVRYAGLMARIKTSRGSRKRAAILMELLLSQ
jgi:hypothetical protein